MVRLLTILSINSSSSSDVLVLSPILPLSNLLYIKCWIFRYKVDSPYRPTEFSSSLLMTLIPCCCWTVSSNFLLYHFLTQSGMALASDSSVLLILPHVSSFLLALALVEVLGFSLIIAAPFCVYF